MVNSSTTPGTTDKKDLFEELHNSRRGFFQEPDEHISMTTGGTLDESICLAPCAISQADHEDSCSLREDTGDLYEVIPAHFAPKGTTTKQLVGRDDKVNEELRESTNMHLASTPEIHKTEYAEIVVAHKVTEITPSRPTRESDNPILREDFAGNLSFLPNLRDVRKGLSLHTQQRLLERDKASTPSARLLAQSQQRDKRTPSPSPSPRRSPDQSPSSPRSAMPLYVNLDFPLIESDRESRRSSLSSTGEKSLSSLEGEVAFPEYENVKIIDGDARKPNSSRPVDILYSDLDFKQDASSLVKCASSPGTISKFMERSKTLCPSASPRLPSRDHPSIRPKSICLQFPARSSNSGPVGTFMARYVGKATVQRSSEKSLEAAVDDITASTKADQCVSVIVEIDSDKMRFSTNREPWELIASFKLEDIGCAKVCEHDRTLFGVLEGAPGKEATCYVLRCPDADAIYKLLEENFRAAPKNEAVSPWLKPRVRTGEVATFDRIAYVGCLKVKKSYLVIKDSIAELLEKVNPKDFKSVSLEVHPGEIRLTETNSDKLLQEHALPWILSIGVFDRDPRLFGYIKTEAKQGEKTRMFCHVFRCGRITTSVTVTEAIRLGCQASYMTDRGNTALNRRRSSNSISSQGSTGESSCSLADESAEEISERVGEPVPSQRPGMRRFSSMPMLRKLSKKKSVTGEPVTPVEGDSGVPTEPHGIAREIEPTEEVEFRVKYLCSTVINPPLRPKHLRECVKQFQKQQAKAHKRQGAMPSSSEVSLTVEEEGVHLINTQRTDTSGRMFFPFSAICCIRAHPDWPQYFAFATAVGGDTKHKCHVFLREDIDGSAEVIRAFQDFVQE